MLLCQYALDAGRFAFEVVYGSWVQGGGLHGDTSERRHVTLGSALAVNVAWNVTVAYAVA